MADSATRAKPVFATVRDLFAHSGNRCAFEGCDHPLIDEHGNFVAQVCHIKAALPGGERYDAVMTDEERRHRDNLLLMCLRHHVETNDVKRFPVEAMQEIKNRHEAAFAAGTLNLTDAQLEDAVQEIIESSIVDLTKRTRLHLPRSLSRLGEFESDDKWSPTTEELLGSLETLTPMLERLKQVPVDSRGVLLIVVERGQSFEEDMGLPVHELEQVANADPETLQYHALTLERWSIAALREDFGDERSLWWLATRSLEGWDFWRELKGFCETYGVPLESFVIDLRFDQLDGPPDDLA